MSEMWEIFIEHKTEWMNKDRVEITQFTDKSSGILLSGNYFSFFVDEVCWNFDKDFVNFLWFFEG